MKKKLNNLYNFLKLRGLNKEASFLNKIKEEAYDFADEYIDPYLDDVEEISKPYLDKAKEYIDPYLDDAEEFIDPIFKREKDI